MKNIFVLLFVFGESARARGSWKSICSLSTCLKCERIIWTYLDSTRRGLYQQVNVCNLLLKQTRCCDSVMRKEHFASGDFGSLKKPSCCTEESCDPSSIISPSNFFIAKDEDENLIDYEPYNPIDTLSYCTDAENETEKAECENLQAGLKECVSGTDVQISRKKLLFFGSLLIVMSAMLSTLSVYCYFKKQLNKKKEAKLQKSLLN